MYTFINKLNNVKPPHNGRKNNTAYMNNYLNQQSTSHIEQMREAKTVSLFSQPYLDVYNQCYKNIVVVNLPPQGPLGNLVRRVNFPPLSEFKQPGPCTPLKLCGYALITLGGCNMGCGKTGENLMSVDEVPDLISFLVSNGYKVDTSITKMFNTSDIRFDANTGNKLICFVTYNG
jgi:hypothetical protein